MAEDTYLTLEAAAEAASREQSSKFLAYAYPVRTEEEIREHLDALRKRHFDATHHCYAWRLGPRGERWRANDDGEPSGTAGKPILGQLLSAEVTDCLIVVVRYFGGTKLGVPGLIAAYREAAAEAQSIRVLDPSLINDDFTNGTNIDVNELTWALAFKPKTFATSPERMYATGSNDAINVYDYAQKEWVKTLKSVKGFAFGRPERICKGSDGTFWISDITKNTLVRMGVFKGEIREYEPINKNVVKVRTALTRSGEDNAEFYVDLRTHEIIDPEEE